MGAGMEQQVWVFRFDAEAHNPFVLGELFSYGRLRQSWGTPGCCLKLPEGDWVQRCLRARPEGTITEAEVQKRRNILVQMLQMNAGDVLIIPKASPNKEDTNFGGFTVATVTAPYIFQDMTCEPIQDFGHVLSVTNLKTFLYGEGEKALTTSILGAPFMNAVNQVKPHFKAFPIFSEFLDANYR